MTDHRFPPELVNKFFSHLSDASDLATLKAVSLVCSTWRAVGCSHLFRQVVVTNEARLDGFEALLQSGLGVERHVRTLTVRPRPFEILGPSPWVADVPARLAPLLVRLQTIELVELHEHDTPLTAGFIAQLAGFASVDGLTLRDCSMAPSTLHALIAALPALRAAALSSTIAMRTGPDDSLPQLRSPALESLEVRPVPTYLNGMDMILPWLGDTATAQSLRTLKLTVRLQDAFEIGQFIGVVGARLEQLDLELESFLGLSRETVVIKQNIAIGHCQRLRSFAVHDAQAPSPAVIQFLNELNSSVLETITLNVTRNASDPGQLPDMSQLAGLLGEMSFRSLKEVRFAYPMSLAVEVVHAGIQAALNAADFRGHLSLYRA